MNEYFHNLESFIKHGLKEWSTWVGIAVLLFGAVYYKEINQLIHNVLTSQLMADKIIDGLAILAGFLFIIYKEKNNKNE